MKSSFQYFISTIKKRSYDPDDAANVSILVDRQCTARTFVLYIFFFCLEVSIFITSLFKENLNSLYYILHITSILCSLFFVAALNPTHKDTRILHFPDRQKFLFPSIVTLATLLTLYEMVDVTINYDYHSNFMYLLFCLVTFTYFDLLKRSFLIFMPTIVLTIFYYIQYSEFESFYLQLGVVAFLLCTLFYSVSFRDYYATYTLQRKQIRLETLIEHDYLTGLYNRYHLADYMKQQHTLHKDETLSGHIYFCDIDFFKKYNDTFGHLKGDELLITVSQLLKDFSRQYNGTCFRFGGEEFIIILIDHPGHKTPYEIIGQKMSQYIESQKLTTADTSVSDYLTISIGGSAFAYSTKDDFKTYIQQADDALYEAKNRSRNTFIDYASMMKADA